MDFNDDELEEDLKNEEEEVYPLNLSPTKTKRHFRKRKTTNLSSFPTLISIKENPHPEKMEEKKDLNKNLWIPDDDVQNCYNCGSKFFSLFNRKHHCRVCGNIFCKSCLETFYEITIYNENQELKVCAYCLEKKRELNDVLKNNLVEYMDENGNKIFKTKTWDYAFNKKKNVIHLEKFCGFNNSESKLLKDFHKNLDKNYEFLLEKMIKQVLTEKTDKIKYPNLFEEWGKIIYDLTSKVINNLSPTFQNLNDSININDYLKIKTIEYRDQSKCEVIDGYALRKNNFTKGMRNIIINPKILLLKGPLEALRTNRGNLDTTNKIVVRSTAIEAYTEIIKRKIQELSPQIILVEGNVSPKFQNMDILIINKVNIKKLNRIARCVKSFVVPSPDLLGKNIVLGSCAKFEMTQIKKGMSVENRNYILHMKQEQYNLMKFEGCGKILFNTVILSGHNKEELKELKRLMKIITKTARHLYCQKFLLKYFNMLYEPSILIEQEKKKEKINKNSIRRKSSIFREDNYLFGFDTEIVNLKSNEFECIYMNLQNKNKSDLNNSHNISLRMTFNTLLDIERTNNVTNINANSASLKESEVLKSTPNQCMACSYTMNAYSVAQDEEKTLGQNILSFLEEAKERCEKCGEIKLNHISFIYKGNGRIRISLYNLNEQLNLIDKVADYLGFNENLANSNKKKEVEDDDIYSYGFCEQCNRIVTPLVKLPEEILNFSATKFYQNILYNKKLINFGDEHLNILNFNIKEETLFDLEQEGNAAYNCQKLKHIHYRDISRLFMTKNGVVKFKYEEIIKYKLLGSQLNTNTKYYKEYNKNYKNNEIAIDKMLTLNTLEDLKGIILIHKKFVESLKSENFGNLINRVKKVVDETIQRIEELKKKNEQIFQKDGYENIFLFNNQLKKYLLKIMNIKIISNKLLKEIKRIKKLIFFEEIDNINEDEEEEKTFELSPKNPEEENDNSIHVRNTNLIKLTNENNQNKEDNNNNKNNNNNNKNNNNNNPKYVRNTNLIKLTNENIQNKEDNNKNDLNVKNNINSSLPNNSERSNLSNSSSVSDDEENDDDNESKDLDIKIEEKEKLKEEISNSKLPDLSLKKSIFNLFNTNPELKEKVNAKHIACLNELDKYTNNILALEKNENIRIIISKLNYYDKNHSTYSVEVNDEDICSIITYALTSDKYLDAMKIDNKNGLNEIKSEFINNDISNDDDNDLFCATSLLYDKEKVKFSLGNYANEKISQILQNELISNENKECCYEVKYNPSSVFNEIFGKKSKKAYKNNPNSKINYTEFDQKLNLMNSELKNIKSDVKSLISQTFEEINGRFNFPKNEIFAEEKLPTKEMRITTYYTKHFESFRILYGASYFDFLHSIIKSQVWSSVTGGKSKAHFFKSWDEKYVVKCLEKNEFDMFIESCFHYFVHNNKYFFFKMPSSLAKVFGAFEISINSEKKSSIYCVIMENLNYSLNKDKVNIVTYDLKGSEINRYVKNREDNSKVLMDTNFVEDFGGEPLALDQKIYTLFLCAISNDTKICRNMDVMDYSLLCIIIDYKEDEIKEENEENIILRDNENVKYIRLGVIDYFRKYTSDKQFETIFKTIINKFNKPTVINPKKYDERFFKKLSSYFIGS